MSEQEPVESGKGVLFLLLALVSGVVGGVDGIFSHAAHANDAVVSLHHVILLAYFAIPVAFLGGIGRLTLSAELLANARWFSPLDDGAFFFLTLGLIGLFVQNFFAYDLSAWVMLAWCGGMFLLAANTIAYFLEARRKPLANVSIFSWTQFCTALGYLVFIPFLAAVFIKGLGVHHDAASLMISLNHALAPTLAFCVVPTIGLAAALLPACHHPAREFFFSLLVWIGCGTTLVWACLVSRGVMVSQLLILVGIVFPTVSFMCVLSITLWRAHVNRDAASLWCFAALVLLGAGGIEGVVGRGPDISHPLAFLAAVFALFGGYYRWQSKISQRPLPERVGVIHALITMGGVVMRLAPSPQIQHFGDKLLITSFGFIAYLGWRMVKTRSQQRKLACL